MAAALLPQGARRIGGSMLQRTQAVLTSPAVAEERRRQLVRPRRRMYSHRTDKSMDDQIKHLEEQLAAEFRGHLAVERKVRQNMEELYDLIDKAEQSFWTSSFRNRRLQQLLAVRIDPRPEDSEWRRLRFARRVNSLLEAAGMLALIGVVASGLARYIS